MMGEYGTGFIIWVWDEIIFRMYAHEQVQNLIMKSYEIKQQIGEGTSSRVYKAFDTKTKLYHAIKVIPKQYLNSNPKLYQLVKNEIEILKACNNANIIKCYDVFQTSLSILIVTQLCNGCDMEKYLKNRLPLPQDQATTYLKQILNGFKGLHDVGVMHRDFKLANLLLNNEVCKIADLGFAKKMEGSSITYTMLGTCITMAPQVMEGNGYGFGADVWSLGVVFYQMLYGRYPFVGFNVFQLLKNIRSKEVEFGGRRISPEARQFIKRCLTPDQKSRISWQELYTHPLLDKPSLQLLFSPFNTAPNLLINQQFYKKNSLDLHANENQAEYDSLLLLRHSGRKKLIIQEIGEIIRKDRDTIGGEEQGKGEGKGMGMGKFQGLDLDGERDGLMFQYAKEYIKYFNRLSCCVKFLRPELVEHRRQQLDKWLSSGRDGKYQALNLGPSLKILPPKPTPELHPFLYLLSHKPLSQLVQYKKILQTQLNIFKIPKHWPQFCQSPIYAEMQSTIEYNIGKVESIVKGMEKEACLSGIEEISCWACQPGEGEGVQQLWGKYGAESVRKLMEFYRMDEREDERLYLFMEGLLYYLIQDQRAKPTPEQFDLKLSQPYKHPQMKEDLLERFSIFFTFM